MRHTLVLLLAALLSTTAQAQTLRNFEKVAHAGQLQALGRVSMVDMECRPMHLPELALLDGPRQGKVTTEIKTDFVSFSPQSPTFKCNGRKAPTLQILYQAPAGASGDDDFTVEFIDNVGNSRQAHYHVTIR